MAFLWNALFVIQRVWLKPAQTNPFPTGLPSKSKQMFEQMFRHSARRCGILIG
jgi:hypothetical protein